jgi:hypothetical protein
VTDKSADGPGVYPAGNGWTETGITWANKPARTGPRAADLGAVAKGTWVEYDVTGVVTGNGDWTFALAGPAADGTVFSSREGADPPQLVVTADSPPDPGPPDTTPPDTALGSVTVDGDRATFPFTATEANSTFQCQLDGAAFAACTSPAVYAGLVVSDHTFAVRAVDPAGNTDPTPATTTVTVVDTTPPETAIASAVGGDGTATFSFTATEANATFGCRLDGSAFALCTSPKTYSGLTVGSHTFAVRAADAAGNVDQTPATASVTVTDTTPPETAIDAVSIDRLTARFDFTAGEPGARFACRLDGAAFAPCTAPVSYDNLALGAHTFAVAATDAAGNTDPSPALSHFTIDPGSIRDALLAPATGAWFGLYAHTDVYSQPESQAALTRLEAAVGRTADIDHWYEPWGDVFPTWRQPWDFANGRIPMISWGKQYSDRIISGADDAYIAARADGIKALGKDIFLRWFWEMDGNRNLAYSQSPETYIAAWRHIHDIFTARGATNVAWVWCPNASSFTNGSAQPYYPGDDVVDWICADGYNFWPDSRYREFEPIFTGFYTWASQRPKPLMIGEWGDQQAGPGQRAAWFDAAHAALMDRFPRILAVVYFNSNSLHNWMFYDEPDALEAVRRMALDPYFNPTPIYPRP